MPQQAITPFALSPQALSRLNTLPTAKMAVTRGIFPRYALALKAASKVSDESKPSGARRRLARHSPQDDVDFVCSEHLTTKGNGFHTLHKSVNKRAHALTGTITPRTRPFKISALTAAIHEKNTGTKVHPSRITPVRSRSTHKLASSRDISPLRGTHKLSPLSRSLVTTTMESSLSASTTAAPLALSQDSGGSSLAPTRYTSSADILEHPLPQQESPYSTLLCNDLKLGTVDIGKIVVPTRYDVMRTSRFGKPSLDHSFTSEACFEHILIHILKTDVLSLCDTEALLSCHPLFLHLHNMLHWTKRIDFSSLGNPIVNYSEQANISMDRVMQFLASALFYDLDLSTVIRSLRGTYTGEFRDAAGTLAALRQTNCDPALVQEVFRTLIIGYPNKMNACSSHENFLKFFRYGNHVTIKSNPTNVRTTLNKEDRNQYLLPFPNWIARFCKNIHLTPQGLLSKLGKNDRLIWDGSFIPEWDSTCVNMMLNGQDEPEIHYGDALLRHINRIWNLRISFPSEELYLFDDDVKGAFRHPKYHPDVAGAFSFVIENHLFVSLGQTFGSLVSPQNWEPLARARTHLAAALSHRRDLLAKYQPLISKVEFSPAPESSYTFTQAVRDSLNPGVSDSTSTTYNMFVDDSLYVHIASVIKHSMAASIEALYIVLGYPNDNIRIDALSLDKFFQSICSYERIQLGVSINTRTMTIGLSNLKRLSMIDELKHWHKGRRSFTLLQGVTLCGILEFWSSTSCWGRFLFLALRAAVTTAFRNASSITKDKRIIKVMISELARTPKPVDLRVRFLQRNIAREIYQCKAKAHVTKNMKIELKIIHEVLLHPLKYNLTSPIAHLATRLPDFTGYSDACLEAAGAQVPALHFWWHIEWPHVIKSLTLKHLRVTRKCPLTNKLISINLLEFVAEIITYAAVTVFFSLNPSSCSHPYPVLLIWTDNMSAKAWIKKAAMKTSKGMALQRILCNLMINNPVGLQADFIPGL